MTAVGCYALDLYCRHIAPVVDAAPLEDRNRVFHAEMEKHGVDWPAQYTGGSYAECRLQARRHGWIFHRDGDVTCPKCAKRKKA